MSATTSSTVDDIVRRSATRHPDRVALVFDDRTWTYAALDDAVSRAAGTCSVSGWPAATGSRRRASTPTPTCSPSSAAPGRDSSTCRSTTT